MSKHTPGPWKYFEGSVTVGVARNSPETGDVALIATICSTRPEASANARLIVAAPELLEAAKTIYQMLTAMDQPLPDLDNMPFIDALHRAITKAEGK